MADPKKISQLTPAASVNANDYTVLVDGNNSTNKRATISQILASGVIGGTVTSVNATGSNGIGVSGGPITTSGTLNISLGAITPTSVTASGSITGANLSGTNTGDQTIQLVGDVEAAAGAPTLTTSIASGAVTNAKLANMTGPSIKGRVAAGVGAVSDLSAAQVATILPAVIGDSGSGGTQGLVPAPAAGDAAAKKFLRADATWAAPAINDLLPSQSGQSGKVLKSDGTNVAWQADNGGSGTVTSVGIAGGTDINVSGSPVTTSGTITVGLTASGVGAGTYGSATQVPAITVDSKGRVTSAANTAIAIPSTAVSGLASVATTGAYSSLTGTPSLGTISSQNSNNVNITGGSITGISALAVNSGGTGATSAVDARTNLGLGTIATQAANNVAITGGTMSNVQVSGLPTPVNASDAATKYYVDTFAQGLNPQAAVRAGTTGNITLSGLQTIDGVTLVASDRVLVKNQTNSAENGIYVAAAGAWSRATDANTAAELARGNYYMITEGTANIGDGWVIQTAPSNLGVDPVVFALFTNTVAAVSSISGTASQISASSSTGAITLSLPNTLVAPGTLTASGGITNTAIGASNPSTGAFTTLSASGNLTVSGGTVDITSASFAKISSSTAGSSAALSLISNLAANYRSLQFGYGSTPTYLWKIGYQGATSNDQLNFESGAGTVAQLTQAGALTLSSNLTVSGTGTSTFGGPLTVSLAQNADTTLRVTNSDSQASARAVFLMTGQGSSYGTYVNNTYVRNYTAAALDIQWWTSGIQRATLNASGNLLLGTTTDSGQKLQVAGDAALTGNLTVSGTGTSSFAGTLLQRSSTGVGAIASIGTDTGSYSVLRVQNTAASGRSFDIGTAGSGDATLGSKLYIYDSTAGATRWTMDSSGNIAQTGNLTVSGTVTVSGTGTSSVAGNLFVGTTTAAASGARLQAQLTGTDGTVSTLLSLRKNTNAAGTGVAIDFTPDSTDNPLAKLSAVRTSLVNGYTDFRFSTWNGSALAEQLRLVGQTGNLLIGTTTDGGQKLQVSGTAAITGALSIGNTVQTAASVASTHKVTVVIGGVTYYLLATNV